MQIDEYGSISTEATLKYMQNYVYTTANWAEGALEPIVTECIENAKLRGDQDNNYNRYDCPSVAYNFYECIYAKYNEIAPARK